MSLNISNNDSNQIFHDHSYCKRSIDQLNDGTSPSPCSKRKPLDRSVILNFFLNLFLLFLFQLSELEMNEGSSAQSFTQSQDVKLFNSPMKSSFVSS